MLTASATLVFSLVYALALSLTYAVLRILGQRRRFRRVLKFAALGFIPLLAGFILVLLPVFFSYLLAAAATRPQDQALSFTPESYGAPYEEVAFTTPDGVTLKGWYLDGEQSRSTVVMCHGLFRNRQEVLERAVLLHEAGYPVLLFDLRNHGRSGRKCISLGFEERLDVLAACRFLQEAKAEERFVLFGVSMGAVAVIHAAPLLQDRLQAVIADSPFLSLEDTLERHTGLFLGLPAFPFSAIFAWNLTRLCGYEKEDLDCRKALGRLDGTPVLLLYGENDRRMPEEISRELLSAIPHRHKKLVFFEGAGHGHAFDSDPKRYLSVVLEFLAPLDRATGEHWRRHVIDASLTGADGVRLADVTGDGWPDITTGWEQSGITRVYVNPGPAEVKRPWAAVTVGAAPSVEDAVFADLDSDGSPDVISGTEGDTRTIFIHWAPTDRSRYLESQAWSTEALPPSRLLAQWMFLLPLDMDGRNGIDLVAGSKGPNALIGWFQSPANPRDVSAWVFRPLSKAAWIMSLVRADMDSDGDEDILFSDRRGEQSGCYWLENPGPAEAASKAWNRHPIGSLGREVMFLTPADLDQDGLVDVLAAVKPREISYLRRLQRDGRSWESFPIEIPSAAGTAKAVAVGDIDLDGRLDIVFSCEQAEEGRPGVMRLSYRGSVRDRVWQAHDISGPEGVKYDLVELIDLDQDGDLDLVTCEENDLLGLIWYENPHR